MLIPICEHTYPISHRFQVKAQYWSNFHFRHGAPLFNAIFFSISQDITINHILPKTRFFGLHYCYRQYGSNFNHFYVSSPKLPNSVKQRRHITLRCDLDLWPLTLNICRVSPVTWWNFVPNLNAIEQSAAELLRFQCLTSWPWTCFKCCAWLWDNFHQVWPRQLIRAWILAFLMLIRYVMLWP